MKNTDLTKCVESKQETAEERIYKTVIQIMRKHIKMVKNGNISKEEENFAENCFHIVEKDFDLAKGHFPH